MPTGHVERDKFDAWAKDTERCDVDRPCIGHGAFNCNTLHADDATREAVPGGQGIHCVDATEAANVFTGQDEQVIADPTPDWV